FGRANLSRYAARDEPRIGMQKSASMCRDVFGARVSMDSLLHDLRYASRSLRRSAGFSAIAILTLGLGIGTDTAIFSIADALIARPIRGVKDVDRLAAVDIGQKGRTSAADYEDWARLNHSFDSMTAYRQRNANITGGGPAERIFVTDAARTFFAALGTDAILG